MSTSTSAELNRPGVGAGVAGLGVAMGAGLAGARVGCAWAGISKGRGVIAGVAVAVGLAGAGVGCAWDGTGEGTGTEVGVAVATTAGGAAPCWSSVTLTEDQGGSSRTAAIKAPASTTVVLNQIVGGIITNLALGPDSRG